MGQSLDNPDSMARGSEGIRARQPADTWIRREKRVSDKADKNGEMEGTCADDKEVQGEGSLALVGDKTHQAFGWRNKGYLRARGRGRRGRIALK